MAKRQTIQWPKDGQYNGQKKKNKRTNNDLINTTQKTKYRATQTSLKTGDELRKDKQLLLHNVALVVICELKTDFPLGNISLCLKALRTNPDYHSYCWFIRGLVTFVYIDDVLISYHFPLV
jgi:hypothetical protein